MKVESIAHLIARIFMVQIEMRDLANGVHTRIRTASAMHGHHRPGKPLDRFFHCLLDSITVALPLPADEIASIVFQGQLITGHLNLITRHTALNWVSRIRVARR